MPRNLNYADQGGHAEFGRQGTMLDTHEPGSAAEAACGVQKTLGTIGKRASGADAQPIVYPDEKAIGCHITCRDDYKEYKFNINQ